jgi:protein-S-isoprenylcysteine O-methyltransferase Ste14
MTVFGWHWILAALLAVCLASFAWAMQKFFVQPAGMTAGMKLIKVCGILFGILHLAAILAAPAISTVRGAGGAALYLFALGLFWWALNTNSQKPLSAAFSPDPPAHLVANGPYRTIRHPLYCSYLLCWVAGWVSTGRLWLALTIAVMLVVYVLAAAEEEKKFTRSPLAEAYREYRARTGLFFPNPVKLYLSGRKKSWATRLGSSQSTS